MGVGKMMCVEPHPLGGMGVCFPRKFTCSEVASGPPSPPPPPPPYEPLVPDK